MAGGATAVRQRAEHLRLLTHDELLGRYADGTCPEDLDALEGDPAGLGVGLAVLAGGRVDRALRRRAGSPSFAWHGKSFRSLTATEGYGFNRFGVGPVVAALAFRTSIGTSVLDGRPAIRLDFDIARSPRPHRAVLDELREVLPGVFLGPTGMRLRRGYKQLAWFAVDTNVQVHAVGDLAGLAPGQRHDRG